MNFALAKMFVADPSSEVGNMLVKPVYPADAGAAGIVLGAQIPIISTNRADGPRARGASAAVAEFLAHAGRQVLSAWE